MHKAICREESKERAQDLQPHKKAAPSHTSKTGIQNAVCNCTIAQPTRWNEIQSVCVCISEYVGLVKNIFAHLPSPRLVGSNHSRIHTLAASAGPIIESSKSIDIGILCGLSFLWESGITEVPPINLGREIREFGIEFESPPLHCGCRSR